MIDPQMFQQLTSTEIDRFGAELDQALESHAVWLVRIHRALLFSSDFHPDDLAQNPHLHCHFGRWYHNLDDSVLLDLSEFVAIGEVHARLHHMARSLLKTRLGGDSITKHDYDEFIDKSEQLRTLITTVRQALKQNIGVVSRLMAKVFENAKEGVVLTTPDGVIVNVNRAFTEVTGYSAEEAIGKTPHLLYSGRQTPQFYSRMWNALSHDGQWQGEIWNRRKNGDIYLEWLSVTGVRNEVDQLTHYVGIFSDITTEKENEERLYHLAHYDPLTNLPNRVLFQDRFKHALVRARRSNRQTAVMFLDLDGFKAVNDALGHAAGDELLGQVAARLVALLRKSDTIARLGGDEFAIVLPDMDDLDGLATVARKIIDATAQPFALEAGEARITTSLGISLYPKDGLDPDNLIQRADIAMYEAKKQGKNRYCFYAAKMG